MITPLSGVIFDFDGVIADTESLHLRAYQETLSKTLLSLSEEDYYNCYLGYDDVGVFTALANAQGTSIDNEQLRQWIQEKGDRFDTLIGQTPILFPGAATCIKKLAAIAPLGIASGALHKEIETILSRVNLRQYFKTIVAADDVKHSKPEPDVYLRTVELITKKEDRQQDLNFVAIEDSRWGIKAAQSAGLVCVAVTHSYTAKELNQADLVVTDLSEIYPKRLEKLCASIKKTDRTAQ